MHIYPQMLYIHNRLESIHNICKNLFSKDTNICVVTKKAGQHISLWCNVSHSFHLLTWSHKYWAEFPFSSTFQTPFQQFHREHLISHLFTKNQPRDPFWLSWRWRQFSGPFPCHRYACSSRSSFADALCRASQSSACASPSQWSHPVSGPCNTVQPSWL